MKTIGWWPSFRATVAGQTQHVARSRVPHHLLEAARRQMVTLVDDHVTVGCDAVVDDALSNQALDDGNIDRAGRSVLPAADTANRLGWYVQKRREPLDPLVEQLPAVNEHQRADGAPCNQPRGNDGLAECRRRGQYACVVLQQDVGGPLLFRPEGAAERDA
jgi:hypothetical protein